MTKGIILTLIFILFVNVSFAQNLTKRKAIRSLNKTAASYLLNFNRPFVEIETDHPGAKKLEISIFPSIGDEYFDLPFSLKYGISDNLSFAGYFDLYTTSYNLSGKKFSGIGDFTSAISYKFHQSDLLEHYAQVTIKIPTGSSKGQIGSGKADFDFGVAQVFTYNNLTYDLTVDINFLGRTNFPSKRISPTENSLSKNFDYSYEPKFNLSLSPTYFFTKNFNIETGIYFSRNTKLNYNFLNLYSNLGYTITKHINVYSGIIFTNYKQANYNESEFYSGMNYSFSENFNFGLDFSLGIHNYSGYLLTAGFDLIF